LMSVHDDGFSLGAATIHTHHRILRVQAPAWREICCASFGAHNRGSVGPMNGVLNIFEHFRSR
jgi:hypothetical protein